MTRRRLAGRWLGVLLMLGVALPATAAAQTAPPATRKPRPPSHYPGVTFVAAVGASADDPAFDQDVRFTLFAEDGSIRGPVSVSKAPRVEAALGFHVWRRVGAGIALSYFQGTGDMRADFRLPSPFLVGAPIEVSGDTTASRRVADLHVQALFNVIATPRWHVVAFAGPSLTFLSQQFGHDRFAYRFEFPFTEASLTERDAETTGSGIGGHLGASVIRRMGGVGLIGGVRFSVTRAELSAFDTPFTLDTGGVQISAGLRFGF